jgi:aldehyde dehydrogenase (NAD+)
VLSILSYRDLDDAIRIANATDLGRSAASTPAPRTRSPSGGTIRTGTVQVNTGLAAGYTPMGDFKQSGYGPEPGAPRDPDVPGVEARGGR